MGGYTLLQWPLRLLFDYASIPSIVKTMPSERSRRISHAAPRLLAAFISAWFSLELLNYKVITKVELKVSKQVAQDQQQQHVANSTRLTLQTSKTLNSKNFQASPHASARKTVDLTLLAVTRAIDSLIVNLYRRSYSSVAETASSSSTLTAVSRHADTFVFALSSGTVVCLHFGAIP